jgi:hypothetical protein
LPAPVSGSRRASDSASSARRRLVIEAFERAAGERLRRKLWV